MDRSVTDHKWAAIASICLGILVAPSGGEAAPVIVQTVGHPLYATAGDSDTASLSVLVYSTVDGLPISNLGDNVGDGTSVISLPPGWRLLTNGNAADFGIICNILSGECHRISCGPRPTKFRNRANGQYVIDVKPGPSFPCGSTWSAGDYHYTIAINVTVGGSTFTGNSLGVLEIPDAPP